MANNAPTNAQAHQAYQLDLKSVARSLDVTEAEFAAHAAREQPQSKGASSSVNRRQQRGGGGGAGGAATSGGVGGGPSLTYLGGSSGTPIPMMGQFSPVPFESSAVAAAAVASAGSSSLPNSATKRGGDVPTSANSRQKKAAAKGKTVPAAGRLGPPSKGPLGKPGGQFTGIGGPPPPPGASSSLPGMVIFPPPFEPNKNPTTAAAPAGTGPIQQHPYQYQQHQYQQQQQQAGHGPLKMLQLNAGENAFPPPGGTTIVSPSATAAAAAAASVRSFSSSGSASQRGSATKRGTTRQSSSSSEQYTTTTAGTSRETFIKDPDGGECESNYSHPLAADEESSRSLGVAAASSHHDSGNYNNPRQQQQMESKQSLDGSNYFSGQSFNERKSTNSLGRLSFGRGSSSQFSSSPRENRGKFRRITSLDAIPVPQGDNESTYSLRISEASERHLLLYQDDSGQTFVTTTNSFQMLPGENSFRIDSRSLSLRRSRRSLEGEERRSNAEREEGDDYDEEDEDEEDYEEEEDEEEEEDDDDRPEKEVEQQPRRPRGPTVVFRDEAAGANYGAVDVRGRSVSLNDDDSAPLLGNQQRSQGQQQWLNPKSSVSRETNSSSLGSSEVRSSLHQSLANGSSLREMQLVRKGDDEVVMQVEYNRPMWAYLIGLVAALAAGTGWSLITKVAYPSELKGEHFYKSLFKASTASYGFCSAIVFLFYLLMGAWRVNTTVDRDNIRRLRSLLPLLSSIIPYVISRMLLLCSLCFYLSSSNFVYFYSLPALFCYLFWNCTKKVRLSTPVDAVGVLILVGANVVVLVGDALHETSPPPNKKNISDKWIGISLAIVASLLDFIHKYRVRAALDHFTPHFMATVSCILLLAVCFATTVGIGALSAPMGNSSPPSPSLFHNATNTAMVLISSVCLIVAIAAHQLTSHYSDCLTLTGGSAMSAASIVTLYMALSLPSPPGAFFYATIGCLLVGGACIVFSSYALRRKVELPIRTSVRASERTL